MNKQIRKTLIAVLSIGLLVGGLSACSRGYHHDWSAADSAEMRDSLTDKLDLDAAQQQKLNVLVDQLQALHQGVRGDAGDPRSELAGLISGATFDRSRAQALLDAKTKALQDNAPQAISALADFYDSLNPAQQQQVRDRLEGCRGWFRHGW
ncbi:Spy/CpxP family protein refolding chaperone [Pseudomonas sp. N040]|uniref:Spy/CpxP family protein refolding chaperone n=1 Tax=Pseudomonas sp. N040 TaxID=2785325 RepID=UPI0018A2E99F|nr:periplasmic heavy metal sensor [Pseudomonas sp. N040]MBF7731236.1 periplasmic heavy metal sensor [Pseudomonas sp. N040]MBW7014879.1 periplasmic heavy metal sensor [Pseudomonas sp. N040]